MLQWVALVAILFSSVSDRWPGEFALTLLVGAAALAGVVVVSLALPDPSVPDYGRYTASGASGIFTMWLVMGFLAAAVVDLAQGQWGTGLAMLVLVVCGWLVSQALVLRGIRRGDPEPMFQVGRPGPSQP